MIYPMSPARVAVNKMYPASIYARPALAPLMVGVGGQTGKAQEQLAEMYKYTLQQMAVSPFSVNSEEYMKRIRDEYGYADDGTYDTMGMIGSVVGAGVGAALGAGMVTRNHGMFRSPRYLDGDTMKWRSPITLPSYTLRKPWYSDYIIKQNEYNKYIKELFKDDPALIKQFEEAFQNEDNLTKFFTDYKVPEPVQSELKLKYQNTIDADTRLNFYSRRQRTAEYFRPTEDDIAYSTFRRKNIGHIREYNNHVDELQQLVSTLHKNNKKLKKVLKNITDEDTIKIIKQYIGKVDSLKDVTDAEKYTEVMDEAYKLLGDLKKKDQVKDIVQISADVANTAQVAATTYTALRKAGNTVLEALGKEAIVKEVARTLGRNVKKAKKVVPTGWTEEVVGTVNKGAKLGTKLGTVALGTVGMALDAASAGINISGAVQAFKDDDIFSGALYVVGALGDVTSIVGDALSLAGKLGVTSIIGAPVGAVAWGLGELLNLTGAIVSIAAGALVGSRVGETIGHSLTPEGARAQQLFANNLLGSISARPLTSVATILTTWGVPKVLNRLSSNAWSLNKDGTIKRAMPGVIQKPASWLAHNAWGGFFRSGLTMGVTQLVNKGTTALEDMWRPPEDASDINFVTAFSVVGDLNDNLFGATNIKSALLGLAKGDPSAQTKALARAWGKSNEDIYYNPMFDDVREAFGLDLGNLGNSVVGVIGEILVDPQNYAEVANRVYIEKDAEALSDISAKEFITLRATTLVDPQRIDVNNPLYKLMYNAVSLKDGSTTATRTLVKNINTGTYEVYDSTKKYDSNYEILTVYQEKGNYVDTKTNKTLNIKETNFKDIWSKTENDYSVLMSYNKKQLKEFFKTYYSQYISKGEEGVREQRLYSFSSTRKGSYQRIETEYDTYFIDNILKYMNNRMTNLSHNYHTDILAQLEDESGRNDIIKKLNALYSYYGEKDDTTAFINKLIIDFKGLQSDINVYKIYQAHTGFRDQMNIIESATSAVNHIANPIVSIGKVFKNTFKDYINRSREDTDYKYKAKLITTLKASKGGYTQDTLKSLREKYSTKINEMKESLSDPENIRSTEDPTLNDELRNLKDKIELYTKVVKEIEDTLNNINKHSLPKRFKIKIKDTYREVNAETIKEIEDSMNELEGKQVLTSEEASELRKLRKSYVQYYWDDTLNNSQVQYYEQLLKVTIDLQTIQALADKKLIQVLNKVNKFKLRKNIKEEDINNLIRELGITTGVKTDADTLSLEYSINLAEVIAISINNILCNRFTGTNSNYVSVKNLYEIQKLIGDNTTIEDWNNLSTKKQTEILFTIIASEFINDDTFGKPIMHAIKVKNGKSETINIIIDTINAYLKHADTSTGNIKIAQPLAEIDPMFLKHYVTKQVLDANEELIEELITDINNIEEFIKNIDTQIKDTEMQEEDKKRFMYLYSLYKITLENDLDYLLKSNSLYGSLQKWLYAKQKISKPLSLEIFSNTKLYKVLGDKTMKDLRENKISLINIQEDQINIAESPVIKEIYKDYFEDEDDTSNIILKNMITDVDESSEGDNTEPSTTVNEVEDTSENPMDVRVIADDVNNQYNLNNLRKTQHISIFTYKYNAKGIDLLDSLFEDVTNVRIVDNYKNGGVKITIKPIPGIDSITQEEQSFSSIVKDPTQIKGYRTQIEAYVKNLIDIVKNSNGALRIRYNKKYYNGTEKDIKDIKTKLIESYMRTGKNNNKGIILHYIKATKVHEGFTKYDTAVYYNKLIRNAIIKYINIERRNNNTLLTAYKKDLKLTDVKALLDDLRKETDETKKQGNFYH